MITFSLIHLHKFNCIYALHSLRKMIYCVTILGKANEPLFTYKFSLGEAEGNDDDIHMNAVIFSSLDIVEEKLRR